MQSNSPGKNITSPLLRSPLAQRCLNTSRLQHQHSFHCSVSQSSKANLSLLTHKITQWAKSRNWPSKKLQSPKILEGAWDKGYKINSKELISQAAGPACSNLEGSSVTTALVMIQINQFNCFWQESRLGSFFPSSSPVSIKKTNTEKGEEIYIFMLDQLSTAKSEVHCCLHKGTSRLLLPLD